MSLTWQRHTVGAVDLDRHLYYDYYAWRRSW